jgi:hypothetical protein
MAKHDYEEKKAKLARLFKEQADIESQIRALLEPERVAVLPRGFSMSAEVLRVVTDAGKEGVTSQDVLRLMLDRYPDAVDREMVASALAYLKNTKRAIEQATPGIYTAVKTETAAEGGGSG